MTAKRRLVHNHSTDEVRDGPPSRRAKIAALNGIAAHLKRNDQGPSGMSSSGSYDDNAHIPKSENVTEGQSPNNEESSLDTCAICLNEKSDPTLLDNCSHSFCYTCTTQWLKHAGKCPLCMKKVEVFWHRIDLREHARPKIVVSELQAAAEAERLANRGEAQPPHDERECIRLRIRRLQQRLAIVQQRMSANGKRVERSSELSRTHVRYVNEISRLEMLKRDTTTRGELIGNIVFRSLIYKDNLEWSSIDRNANRVAFSPEVFRANERESAKRLREFLKRELLIVWRIKEERESKEEYTRNLNATVSEIINWCSECQINSPQFSRNLRLVGVCPVYLDRFQSELFEFASSMLSVRDFDRTSAYSSRELRNILHRRRNRNGNSQEVVMLSDSDSDSGVIPLDERNHGRRRNNNEDVIVLSDDNATGDEEPIVVEDNFVRDEPTSSTSEASNSEYLYARPPCLLPRERAVPVLQPFRPMGVVDAFGTSHDLIQLASLQYPRAYPADPMLLPSQAPTGTDAVDTTIVLSSDDEDGMPRTNRSSQRSSSSNSWRSTTSSPICVDVFPNDSARLMPANQPADSAAPSHGHVPAGVGNLATLLSQYQQGVSNAGSFRSEPSSSASADRSGGTTPFNNSSTSSNNVGPSKWQVCEQKSLFGPSNKARLAPSVPVPVKGENTLLSVLAEERRRRIPWAVDPSGSRPLSCNGSEQPELPRSADDTVSAPAMDEALRSADVQLSLEPRHEVEDVARRISNLVGIFDEPSQNSEAVQNAHDLEKVEPASDDGSRKRGESKKKRRHKSTSWRSLFKRFRRKLHNEKSARKRDRVYRFVTEIKKKLDDDRHSDRSRIRDRSAERRREESPRRSPSKDAETMKRRLSRSASPPSRASVSDSESRRGSEREAAATSSRKRSHSN